jgi:dTDP-glucose 4,6-dehydratase
MSTDEVFGSAEPGERFTADSPLAPNSPYAASKAAGEHLLHAFAHTYGLPVVTINPTNNYGPRQMPEKLIPKMTLMASRRQPLPLYGDGLHERDWLHVEDCCRAIRTVAWHGDLGHRYLAGADNGLSNLAVVESICDILDELLADGGERRSHIRHVGDRPGHDRRYAVDCTPLQGLRWAPQTPFAKGLRETVAWYLDNPAWTGKAEAALHQRESASSAGAG